TLERPPGAFIAGILNPELGGYEQLAARHTTCLDPTPHGLLVEIGGRGVYQSITNLDGIPDGAFTFLEVAHLEHAKPQNRHLYAVRKCQPLHSAMPFDSPRPGSRKPARPLRGAAGSVTVRPPGLLRLDANNHLLL